MDSIKDNGLKWFRHVMRKEETVAIRTVMEMNVEGKRGRERSKKRLCQVEV